MVSFPECLIIFTATMAGALFVAQEMRFMLLALPLE